MHDKVQELLASEDGFTLEQMANKLETSVREIIVNLPQEMASLAGSEDVWGLIEELPSWGKVTAIMQNEGSVFEFKGEFPKGSIAHGYFNFMHHKNPFHGHLLVDGIVEIAFVSKPHRGTESHSMVFLAPSGNCVFKVFLGRDAERKLIPEQVERFKQLKQLASVSV
ncbi:heme utilization cystosolic carrier protein HutX [Microbulbifer agarilyticus]|uniref:heme utilization cystosolic carrier protein HutX n=1 Tax=Microbulbifer agarilyticus TaxID=260552 RepID=UPI001CD51397|nr:heme utilization cystosolic carrier protein HutX [Microbulbifer agarilyticus]MCA0899531.1 heme utilization cystosolic carrier protein HutX [Microbulbifer agarilyticus]